MAEELSERQQRAAERILEDEGLTEDLTDTAARALVTWASEQASALAGDTSRSDEQLGEALKKLRKVVRSAAAAGEEDPATLIAQAKTALSQALDTAAPVPQSASVSPSNEQADKNEPSASAAHTPATQPEAGDPHPTVKPKPATKPKPAIKPKPKHPSTNTITPDQGNAEVAGSPHESPVMKPADQPAPAPEEHLSDEERYARWLQTIENDNQE